MRYRDYDDDYYSPDEIDAYADQYFSRVYDSPEERVARLNPKSIVVENSDDGYDAWRDENNGTFHQVIDRNEYDSMDRYYL